MREVNLKRGVISVLIVVSFFGSSCDTPRPASLPPTSPPQTPAPIVTTVQILESTPEPTSEPMQTATPPSQTVNTYTMTLEAVAEIVKIASRPEPFEEPESLDQILLPEESHYRPLTAGSKEIYRPYDVFRVEGKEGEAWLDLGALMRMHFLYDTVLTLIDKKLLDIPIEAPILQRVVLTMHLAQGGAKVLKDSNGSAVALTTPNAVIIVSGTQFFVAYDPTRSITWVGKFDGELDVWDRESGESISLADQTMIVLAPNQELQEWLLHDDHMTVAEFERLIRLLTSPIGAADMISGPYLIVQASELNIRSEPRVANGNEVGYLEQGMYSRILQKSSNGWWEIECPPPQYLSKPGTPCWVSGGDQYTRAYNTDPLPIFEVEVTEDTPTTSGGCWYIGQFLYVSDSKPEPHEWLDGCPITRPKLETPPNRSHIRNTDDDCTEMLVTLAWNSVTNPTPVQTNDGQKIKVNIQGYEWEVQGIDFYGYKYPIASDFASSTEVQVYLNCGNYEWRVRAISDNEKIRNFDWSERGTFSVYYPFPEPGLETAPYETGY